MTKTNIYDLSDLAAVSAEPAFLKTVAKSFVDTIPHYLDELHYALATENWELVGRNAHKIKSTVDCMGISTLKNEIRALEALGKTKRNLEKIPYLVSRVTEILSECYRQLKIDYQL